MSRAVDQRGAPDVRLSVEGCYRGSVTTQMEHVMIAIETVNYSLKSGTDEASFRSALQQTNQWLTTQKGFVRLQHGADEKGGRIDIV